MPPTAYTTPHAQTWQTIEPLPSTYLSGFEMFEPSATGHCHSILNFLEELEYVFCVFRSWPHSALASREAGAMCGGALERC
ncbi:hypothetical protein BO71DRAFT_434627 [Aspergillus ellipticus CBS 707.79]|uniref:Uncharacterized protein n=1 Tax=Aspergillus ellipticus CBS 707.79 TaxID=1448320 RepID=A0A319DNJ7_9EURO|nr:hypothetical protein BO71DRAFT_434627 [Aspergillus ellipticus CBS 707.79]